MDLCWSNPLLERMRVLLAELFPRRRFETNFGITVGGAQAGKGGTSFIGPRDIQDGMARRDRMLAKGQLRFFGVEYRGDAFWMSIHVDLGIEQFTPMLMVHVELKDPRAIDQQETITDDSVSVLNEAVSISSTRYADLGCGNYGDEHVVALYLSNERFEALGGLETAQSELPEVTFIEADGGRVLRVASSPRTLSAAVEQTVVDLIAPLSPPRSGPHPIWKWLGEA